MTLVRLSGRPDPAEVLRREMQECCEHRWITGVTLAPRLDAERDTYGWGPVHRRVCLRCDKHVDEPLRSRPLKDEIRLNSPSRSWLAAHAGPGFTVEMREVDDGIVVR